MSHTDLVGAHTAFVHMGEISKNKNQAPCMCFFFFVLRSLFNPSFCINR